MTEATHSGGGAKGNGHGSEGGRDDDPLQKRVAEGPRGGARTWYDVLEVAPDVSAVDLKKAYDRALALVEGRSIGGYLMLDPLAAESARADVEAAFAVLGDADRRSSYDSKLRDGSPHEAAFRSVEEKSAIEVATERAADEEQRNARELLEIERAQEGPKNAGNASSPPGLKFTAPAEPSEPAPPSPSRPSSPPRFSIKFSEPPRSAPVAADANNEVIPTRRIMVSPSQEELMEATATVPPEAPMPSPSSSTQASTQTSTQTSSPSAPPPAVVVPAVAAKLGLPDGGEIAGALIREMREALGLTLDDLAEATKIRKPYLRAVEEEDLQNLPARVYLRGFLTQVARVLKVDRMRLAEGYLLTVERLSKTS